MICREVNHKVTRHPARHLFVCSPGSAVAAPFASSLADLEGRTRQDRMFFLDKLLHTFVHQVGGILDGR